MNTIIAYLIAAITIQISSNVLMKNFSRELGIISLILALGLTDNTICLIILISALATISLSNIDEETISLFILSIIGLLVIVDTNSLIVLYLGLELIGLSFYILAGRERKGVKSTEAGIKYFILGALSSGILLLGISLTYAVTGSTSIDMITGASSTMLKIGLLFKLGAAPFHMWVPDVYEGSTILVTIFLAVVPKFAYLSALMRLPTDLLSQGGIDYLLITSGILSIAIGSIGALNQSKFKRLLAYSAIGHIGFMLIGIGSGTVTGFQAAIIYMIIYIVMTLNSFTIIQQLDLYKLIQLRGLSRKNPLIGITLGLGLMSIAGVPPLAGFYNKYLVLTSAVESHLIGIAIAAVILSVISAFYYVRLIRWMYFEDVTDITYILPRLNLASSIILGITLYAILTIMIFPSMIINITAPISYLI